MRQQVRLYTQRQVVETLIHGQASAADFVQLEALKFVTMDLGKMQSAVHGTESAMRSLQDELTRLRLGGGAGEPQAGVLEEIREILAHLRSLADGAAGGGSDKAREIESDPNRGCGSGGSGGSGGSHAAVEASGDSASPAKAGHKREFFHHPAAAFKLAFAAAAATQAVDNGPNESLEQDMLNHNHEHRQLIHGCAVSASASRDPDGEYSAAKRLLAPASSPEAAGPAQDLSHLTCATPTNYDTEGPALERQQGLPGTVCALAESQMRARRSAAITRGAENGNKLPLADDILPDLVSGPSKASESNALFPSEMQ